MCKVKTGGRIISFCDINMLIFRRLGKGGTLANNLLGMLDDFIPRNLEELHRPGVPNKTDDGDSLCPTYEKPS